MILFVISIVLVFFSSFSIGKRAKGTVVRINVGLDKIPMHIRVLAFPLLFILFSCAKEDVNEGKQEIRNVGEEVIDIQEDIIDYVNAYREENNLPNLEPMDIIKEVAATHSSYMIEKGVVSHDNFYTRQLKLKETTNAIKVAENVAYGYTKAESVVKAWVNSDQHRQILEGDYTHVGISAKKNSEGRMYYTLMLIKKGNISSFLFTSKSYSCKS
ncbi:CAP domain-containing protein [Aestuariivivens insulae]|uniref:CAP domain-containing protein n=1 Tax=Aestuariivivens insulae TaxID=1621988 RepID=UPI001F588789|nr:CAP domain-containing protein [Aestuariivivens insulae]